MKVFEINSVYEFGSTGKIVADIKHVVEDNGGICYVAFGRGKCHEKNVFCVSNRFDVYRHVILARLTDKTAFYSKKAARKTVKLIQELDPDIIHIHNIHGYYLNMDILLTYLRKIEKPIVLTLHDCWTFTGHCAYYDMSGCEKWQKSCCKCESLNQYPKAFFDNSRNNYQKKRKLLTNLKNVVIVTPSEWLAGQVEKSFLKKFPVRVINNGIDLNKFYPVSSNLRVEYGMKSQFVIVSVASVWDERKGIVYLIELAKRLDKNFTIVLIGLSEKQVKEYQKTECDAQLVCKSRTSSVEELAQWYSLADVFVNPTLEDNFPTTNIEALACGTPVITFDTGGSPEILGNPPVGKIIPKRDVDALYEAVCEMKQDMKFTESMCVEQAKKFEKQERFEEYLNLFNELINKEI